MVISLWRRLIAPFVAKCSSVLVGGFGGWWLADSVCAISCWSIAVVVEEEPDNSKCDVSLIY